MLHEWHGATGFFGGMFAIAVDQVQNIFFAYGRSVLAPLLWSVAFIAIGTRVFRRESDMESPKKDESAAYSGFWYSLEMFLPIVDLGVAKSWRPKMAPKWRLWYARIHQLAGWVHIPVAVGTLTGSFK
jgi:hypothetical protein